MVFIPKRRRIKFSIFLCILSLFILLFVAPFIARNVRIETKVEKSLPPPTFKFYWLKSNWNLDFNDHRKPLENVEFYAKKLRAWKHAFDASEKSKDDFYLREMDISLFFWIKNNSSKSNASIMWDLRRSFKGKGIVMCVSDKYALLALSTIRMIRQVHQSQLPIEIFYIGNNDLSPVNQKRFNSISNTTTVDIQELVDVDSINISGWSVKTFAMLLSSFKEAMLVDADVVFMQSPETFFKTRTFQNHRALFFQDRTINIDKNRGKVQETFLKALTIDLSSERLVENRYASGKGEHQQESGVVLIDKNDRFQGLVAACILNSGDFKKETYKYVHGDKETFWMGFEIMNQDYGFSPYKPGAISSFDRKDQRHLCSVQLMHFDENFKPSWINGGVLDNKLLDPEKPAKMEVWSAEPAHYWYGTPQHYICMKPFSSNSIHEFTDSQKNTIQQSIQVFKDSLKSFNNTKNPMPSQISPWSYTSEECTHEMYKSEFTHWLKERRWDQLFYKINDYKRDLGSFLRNYKEPNRQYSGRGVVYSCHHRLVSITMISIRFLRHHGSTLPVEVWHYNELTNMDIYKLEYLAGVTVRNLADFLYYEFPRDKDGKIFALKTASIIHSKFDEVLFMDSDNNAVQDPTFLFDSPAFVETGAVFWKDLWKTRPDNPIWNFLGLACVDEFEQESGQILLKKSFPGVQKALDLAYLMQMQSEFYFELTPGDKDTFRLSWRLLNQPFHLVRPHMAVLGPYQEMSGRYCGQSMVQYAPYWGKDVYGVEPIGHIDPRDGPQILFVHANSLKYQAHLGKETIFGSLKHYKHPITLDAVGTFNPDGICVDLKNSNSSNILVDDFKALYPDFELLYRHFYDEKV